MDLPASLASRAYLLAFDTSKGKLTGRGQLGVMLRAAALTELFLDRRLTDVDGKPKATGDRVTDPLLDGILREIAASRPRSWAYWTGRGGRATVRAVQEQLVDRRLISVEPYRVLGIFPARRISVRDTRLVHRLREAVTRALRGDTPIDRLDARDAALAALAAAGKLRVAVSRAQARERKQWITRLEEVAGPAVPALRKVIRQRAAAAAAAGG